MKRYEDRENRCGEVRVHPAKIASLIGVINIRENSLNANTFFVSNKLLSKIPTFVAILMVSFYYCRNSDPFTTSEASMKSTGIKKLYYSISEVSKITDLEQYVLRYWESEFEQLKPAKNRAGNRIYTNKDIKLILYIRQLLREERYTIEGAKQVLKSWTPEVESGEQLQLLPVESQQSQQQAAEAGTISREADPRLKDDLMEVKTFLEELLVKLS